MSTVRLAKNMWIETGVKAGWAKKETLEFYKSASKQTCMPSQNTIIKIAGMWDMWSNRKSDFDKSVTGLERYFTRIYKNLAALIISLQKGGAEIKTFLENQVGLEFPIDIEGSIKELNSMMTDIQETINYVKNDKIIRNQYSNLPSLSGPAFQQLALHLEKNRKIDEATIDNVIEEVNRKFNLTEKQKAQLEAIKQHKISQFFNPDQPTFYETKYKNVA